MLYRIERLKTPPAYLVTFSAATDYENQFQQYREELDAALTRESDPITVIMDVLEIAASVDSLSSLTNKSMKSEIQPLQNPKCKGLILVTDSRLVSYAVEGLKKFGIANQIQAFASVEEALQHV